MVADEPCPSRQHTGPDCLEPMRLRYRNSFAWPTSSSRDICRNSLTIRNTAESCILAQWTWVKNSGPNHRRRLELVVDRDHGHVRLGHVDELAAAEAALRPDRDVSSDRSAADACRATSASAPGDTRRSTESIRYVACWSGIHIIDRVSVSRRLL